MGEQEQLWILSVLWDNQFSNEFFCVTPFYVVASFLNRQEHSGPVKRYVQPKMISPPQQTIPSNQQSTEQVAVQHAADSTTSVAAATAAAVAATAPIVKVRIFSRTAYFPSRKEKKQEYKISYFQLIFPFRKLCRQNLGFFPSSCRWWWT